MIASLFRIALLAVSTCACAIGTAAAAELSLRVDPTVLEFTAAYDGEQRASVAVTNYGSEPERIVARSVDWRTSVDGTVALEPVGTEREHSLTPYLSLSPASFVLTPGETRNVVLVLHMPDGGSRTAGVLWGGFLIKATALQESEISLGPGATVFVYDTVGAPRRHLTLTAVSIDTDAGRVPQLTARLVNDGEGYARPLCRLVVERDDRVVRDVTIPANVIFAGDHRTIHAPLDGLTAGTYHVHLTVDYGGSSILDGTIDVRVR